MNERTVYALGFFDGVHLGHAALLSACRDIAKSLSCQGGVVTFQNHPDALVFGAAPGLINTLSDRDWLLKEQFGMEKIVTLPFDRTMMNKPWQEFFEELLTLHHAAGLVCGEDFRFGRGGAGDGENLTEACRNAGIPCVIVPQKKIGDTVVSSTYIRRLLEQGEMRRAVEFLGHPHILTGSVVHGHRLGRTLGIPTANLALAQGLVVPKFGVYACRCVVDGARYDAVVNIGTRPTVAGEGITVESWLMDYAGDLYGREIRLEFYDFLRPERKFADLQALKAAISADAVRTKEILRDFPLV